MTEQALDRLIHGVILDTARLEYGVLLAEAPEHTFSPAFERRMKKLLRRGRHPVWYKSLHAAACVLLALLLSGCAVLAVSPEAREVFAGWVREIHDNYFLYKFFGNEEREAVSKEEVLYQPTYVPAGYRIEHRFVFSAGIVSVTYIDDQTGNIAVFTYFSDMSSPVLQIAGENEIIYSKGPGQRAPRRSVSGFGRGRSQRYRMGGREEWGCVSNWRHHKRGRAGLHGGERGSRPPECALSSVLAAGGVR